MDNHNPNKVYRLKDRRQIAFLMTQPSAPPPRKAASQEPLYQAAGSSGDRQPTYDEYIANKNREAARETTTARPVAASYPAGASRSSRREEPARPAKETRSKKEKEPKTAKPKVQMALPYKIALGVFSLVFAFSGYMFLKEYIPQWRAKVEQRQIQSLIPGSGNSGGITTPGLSGGGGVPVVPFETLKESNEDFVFWMSLDGAGIADPVVQGKDNDYYLTRTFKKQSNATGSIYLDYKNKPDLSDQNSVLYGHAMKNGTMFGRLKNYKIQAEYEKDPFVILQTKDKVYYYQIFAICVLEAEYDYRKADYGDNFTGLVTKMREKSSITSSAVVDKDSKIITLSTCTNQIDDGRLVVFAVLLNPDGGQVDKAQYKP
ncbi:MAG: class B sortase [Eubacteriaceae bacterium]|nr:class B sortase [Eubacteriaceae bacterium]